MIVPSFWAECQLKDRIGRKRVTVRRFGWSDVSAEDAQRHADVRAQEAMSRILAGEQIHRRDHKVPYNGAEGLPIREEIVSRHGESVVTRNSYGARCLNSPSTLFVDIDVSSRPGTWVWQKLLPALLVSFIAVAFWFHSIGLAILGVYASVIFVVPIGHALNRLSWLWLGDPWVQARRRIDAFVGKHRSWKLRLYRSPAGFRLMATHRPFDPREDGLKEVFEVLQADQLYAMMTFNQNCFRARLSGKPWRMKIFAHMKPRPGVWPVKAERMAERAAWIAAYEVVASDYAACTFVDELGEGVEDPRVAMDRELHDTGCRALESGLALA